MTSQITRSSHVAADASQPLLELTVGDLLRRAAADAPDRPALVVGASDPAAERRWTYRELLADAERVAGWILERVAPGEHVGIWAANSAEWVLAEWAAALAGVVLVTINPALGEREARYIARHAEVRLLLHGPAHRDNDLPAHAGALLADLGDLREIAPLDALGSWHASSPPALPTPLSTDPAQLQYTSGTTGSPKGVLLSHRSLVNVADVCLRTSGVPEGGALLNPLPLFHTAGCVICTLGPVALGGTQVLVERFDAELVLDLLERHSVAAVGTVPTVMLALLNDPGIGERDLGALRVTLSGGATVPAAVVRRWEAATGAAVMILYGQTELGSTVCQPRPTDAAEDKAETIGRPLPHMELKVVDPGTGETVPIGVSGELCARGYQQMIEYFDDPAGTAAAVDADGWLHTGDLCAMDERGYLRVTGRLKDTIIRGGENVSPGEVEEHLYGHPRVHEVAVFGVPDERWGEVVCAAVRSDDAPGRAELDAHCQAGLARHKRPARWFLVDRLPTTASGKVQKFRLVELAAAGELHPLP